MSEGLHLSSDIITPQEGQKIADIYSLGKLSNIYGLLGGMRGWPYLLNTERGSFVFKIYAADFQRSQLASLIRVLTFLEKYNLKIPRLFSTKEGLYWVKVQNGGESKTAVLLSYSQGESLESEALTKKGAIEMIDEILCLHLALSNFPYPAVEKKKNRLQVEEKVFTEFRVLEELVNASGGGLSVSPVVIARAREFLIKAIDEKGSEQWQFIHGDLTRNNFLFKKGQLMSIIDFDDIGMGLVEDDLARFLGEWMAFSPTWRKWGQMYAQVERKYREKGIVVRRGGVYLRTIAGLLIAALGLLRWVAKADDIDGKNWFYKCYNERIEKIDFLISNA